MGGLTAGFGRLWEVVFETIRLGNGHLSYRGLRLPWTQHAFAFAALATGAFAIIALVHHVTMTIRGRGTGTSTFGTYP